MSCSWVVGCDGSMDRAARMQRRARTYFSDNELALWIFQGYWGPPTSTDEYFK